MSDDTPPTLTDARGSGGLRALDGFDFQIWDALVRLPAWLLNPAFEGFILEGLEDFEARFFTPYAPHHHVLDRFQAKSGALTKGEVTAVFTSFQQYAQSFPETARVQVLVTPALPAALQWIARDQLRVRRARPFYRPFQAIMAASDAKLQADFNKEFGALLGPFAAENVEVQFRAYAEGAAHIAFAHAMDEAFPQLDATPNSVRRAFSALVTLLGKQRKTLIARADILQVLNTELGAGKLPVLPLILHIRSDRDQPQEHVLELDASRFAGGAAGFPEAGQWTAHLTEPLSLTAHWAHAQGYRRVRLSGSYRLSTAFAVGAAFRAANGFTLEIPSNGDIWKTDDHPSGERAARDWQVRPSLGLISNRLAVVIGVLRDPLLQVSHFLGLVDDTPVLHLYLDRAIFSSQDAQTAVAFVKQEVGRAVSRYTPEAIDLFFLGPAALAAALGNRWNAMPSTQCYEFLPGSGEYVVTCHVG